MLSSSSCVLHRALALAAVWISLTVGGVHAQSIRVDLDAVPLVDALNVVRAETGYDLVYAQRLVDGRTASCQYAGTLRRAALDCVLRGTGLRAERVRRGQYVLISGERSPSQSPDNVPRVPLSGRVYDAESGETLPGAHVYLTAIRVGATTNSAGYFAIPSLPPGPYTVRVSYLGYETVDTTLTARSEPSNIRLDPATLESEGVVVEKESDEEPEERRLPGMMAVSLDQLEQLPSLGEPDLFKALQWTPGIRKSAAISGGLSVRGADPDQNLYLLDGAPVYHPWHAFSLISTFQTGTLKNTNLYRGAFPAEHGGRLSSVLDAQMKDGNRARPEAVAAVSALSGRYRIESPVTESTSFMLSGRRSYIDKLLGREHPVRDRSTGRLDTLRTGYYFYDMSAKVTSRFNDRHRLAVSYYRGRDDLDLRLPFDLSLDFSQWLRPADLFFEVDQNWENRVLSARHQWLVFDDAFLTTTAYMSRYGADEASFVQPTTAASLDSDYSVDLRDMGAKIDLDYYASVAHQIRAGIQVSNLDFQSRLNTDIQRSARAADTQADTSAQDSWKLTGYLQDIWQPSPRWTLQPGVRVSYFSRGQYVHARPRISARYTVHPRYLVLRSGFGMHVQYLHRIRDRYSLAYDLVSSRWVPASPRVQPATGVQVSFGARSQPSRWLTLELSAYGRSAQRTLIPADAFLTKDGLEGPGIEVGALLGQYVLADERAYGAELVALAEVGAFDVRFGMAAGRTYVRATEPGDDEDGSQLARFDDFGWRPADLDVPYSFRAAVSWTGRQWEASLATEIRSGYPVTEPEARYRLGDPTEPETTTYLYRPQINNGRLPDYLRLDATVGYRFQLLNAAWKAELNLYNATNRANVIDRQFAPSDLGVRVDDRRGLPILPLLEIEMTL